MIKESNGDEFYAVSAKEIIPIVIGAIGALSFGFLTHYVWHPESWIYPLERDVFMLPSYRPVGTSTFTLLNRRTVDIEAELQSEAMKKFQPDRKSRKRFYLFFLHKNGKLLIQISKQINENDNVPKICKNNNQRISTYVRQKDDTLG
jgi:hypothetical protein